MVKSILCSTELRCSPLHKAGVRTPHPFTPPAHCSRVESAVLPVPYPRGASTLQLTGVHIQLHLARPSSSSTYGGDVEEETLAQEQARLGQLVKIEVRAVVGGEEEEAKKKKTNKTAPQRRGQASTSRPNNAFVLGVLFLAVPPASSPAASPPHGGGAALKKKAASSPGFRPFSLPPPSAATATGPHGPELASSTRRPASTLFAPYSLSTSSAFVPLDLRTQMERVKLEVEAVLVHTSCVYPWIGRAWWAKRRREEAAAAAAGDEAGLRDIKKNKKQGASNNNNNNDNNDAEAEAEERSREAKRQVHVDREMQLQAAAKRGQQDGGQGSRNELSTSSVSLPVVVCVSAIGTISSLLA